jgi:putative phosphoribosyl transferase
VNTSASDFGATQSVTVRAGEAELSHGSGSGRHSPRNQFVARRLQAAGLGTLLIDLLTAAEERLDDVTGRLRFDIPFLARRVSDAVEWLAANPATTELRVGLFGASTGAGAALVAAARQPDRIGAVVSRGGRPDLAGDALGRTICPTLLIVGGNDGPVIEMNEDALTRLGTQDKELVVVPGAGHLFEEPGKLEEVARLAANWFTSRLDSGGRKQLD